MINRDFQLRYAGAAVTVGILSTLLTSTLILVPLYQFEILRIPRFLPWPILVMMGAAAVVNVALVGLMGIQVTHRLAGPMYSLVRQIRRIEEGQWHGRLKLREGDDMKYVVRNFNEMVSSIEQRTEHDLARLAAIKSLLDSPGEQAKAKDQLAELEADLQSRLGRQQQDLAG